MTNTYTVCRETSCFTQLTIIIFAKYLSVLLDCRSSKIGEGGILPNLCYFDSGIYSADTPYTF